MCERGGVPLTPHLASFAKRSIRFLNSSSVSDATSPGIAGILTGLLPKRSGVLINEHSIPRNVPTLAGILSSHGFQCGAFIANPVIGPGFGFERGFSTYELGRSKGRIRAHKINRLALDWLDTIPAGEHLFLWVHYMEPHGPYLPPKVYRNLFDINAFHAPSEIPLHAEGDNSGDGGIPFYQQYGLSPVPVDGRDYLLRYAAEVRYMDFGIGQLLMELMTRGFLDDALVVIGADHGEALTDDHGFYFSHENGLTEDQIAVPLLIHFPGCEAGCVVERPVSNVDILPTVLDLLGITHYGEMDGHHLLSEKNRLIVSQSASEQTIRYGSLKLRHINKENTFTLVDLSNDPEETIDLSETLPTQFRTLLQRFKEINQRPALSESIIRKDLQQHYLEALRELGYTE
jgi:arylsulfatase A-like enzyme